MKVIIAGSRSVTDYEAVASAIYLALSSPDPFITAQVTEVVSGGAIGVDRLGEAWAKQHSIPVRQFFPDWSQGSHAGIKRNEEMGRYADAAIIIWDGRSRGSLHMHNFMHALGKPVYLHRPKVAVFRLPKRKRVTGIIKVKREED